MDVININGSNDPYYRYKREKILITNITNNRTRIDNIDKIGKDLNRTSNEIMKALSLLCNTSIVDSNCLKGTYNIDILEQNLTKYINDYILCNHCNNPETIYIKQKDNLGKGCKACGKGFKISKNSKLSRYILKTL